MIRQAHRYFVGAMSGATLIGIAIAVFVVLVSAQVFHAFPLGALTGHSDDNSVAPAKAVATTGGVDANAATGGTLGKAGPATTAAATPTTTGAKAGHKAAHRGANETAVAEANPTVAGDTLGAGPAAEPNSPTSSGSESSSSGPGSTSSSGTTSNSGSSGSSSSSSGSTPSTATASSTPKTSTTKTPPVEEESAEPAPEGLDESVVGTVNGTVGAVDEATGGTLSKTGISGTVETVVNEVAGPESVVGKTVNGLGEVVGGLLGGKKSE
jgi:hypothetical protein